MIPTMTLKGRKPRRRAARAACARATARSVTAVMTACREVAPLAATLVALCVASVASAATEGTAADIEGRWASAGNKLVLDISRCGEGWCGVEVSGTGCGRTSLRVGLEEQYANLAQFSGRFEPAAEAVPYVVQVHLEGTDGSARLHILGSTGDHFEPWRRTFPFSALLARAGDAQCRPDPKVS
jgi:hypothetical protein